MTFPGLQTRSCQGIRSFGVKPADVRRAGRVISGNTCLQSLLVDSKFLRQFRDCGGFYGRLIAADRFLPIVDFVHSRVVDGIGDAFRLFENDSCHRFISRVHGSGRFIGKSLAIAIN